MFTKAFEIFLYSLAYSIWPFIFALCLLLIYKRFNPEERKKKSAQRKKHKREKVKIENLAEKAINFKTPKIETSFGDSRIGEVHNYEEKD